MPSRNSNAAAANSSILAAGSTGTVPMPSRGRCPEIRHDSPSEGSALQGGAAHSPNLAVGFSCADRAGIPVVRTVLGIAAALATPVAREIGRRAVGRCSRSRARRFATAQIADYIENTLLPECDYVFDFHSGGSSLTYVPSALMRRP